jgi:TRAP-type C4-dicarboxylate transport system substrate-binding protein
VECVCHGLRRSCAALRRRQPQGRVDRRRKAFEAKTGGKVEMKFGPSGALKNEIAGGTKAQVCA